VGKIIEILLVDDEPAVRRGLRMRLAAEPDLRVVGEAADGEAALCLAQTLRPDVVVMDVEMPKMNGIAATQALHAVCPHTAVILLTIHDDADLRARAEAAGVAAFVTKRARSDELLSAVRRACAASNANPPEHA